MSLYLFYAQQAFDTNIDNCTYILYFMNITYSNTKEKDDTQFANNSAISMILLHPRRALNNRALRTVFIHFQHYWRNEVFWATNSPTLVGS